MPAPAEGPIHVRPVGIGRHQRGDGLPQHGGRVRAESLLRGPHAEGTGLGHRYAEMPSPELDAVLGQRRLPGVLVRKGHEPGALALTRGGVTDEPDAAQDLAKLREEVRNLRLLARVREVLDEDLVPVRVGSLRRRLRPSPALYLRARYANRCPRAAASRVPVRVVHAAGPRRLTPKARRPPREVG